MDTEKVDAIIIGAGVVGCAVAQRLVAAGHSPWVLESGPRIAEGVTSRNSGVIHSGIYYPPDSLKAKSCIRGQALLYEWCRDSGVPHRKTGKWIVAPEAARDSLHLTYENARASGAMGLTWIEDRNEIASSIPGVRADYAIRCADTGIVDPYEYSRSLRESAEAGGAMFLMESRVVGIDRLSSGAYRVETARGPIEADRVFNCAGLEADTIAKMTGIDRYRIYPWRGNYFRLTSKHRYRALVYPTKPKNAPGLGVHLTLSLDGSYRLGPDVHLVESREDFSPPQDLEVLRLRFFEAASTYLEDLTIDQLEYEGCGVRPKLRSPTDVAEKDFVVSQDLPGFINLVGIESPGLTAALDLADRAVAL